MIKEIISERIKKKLKEKKELIISRRIENREIKQEIEEKNINKRKS